MRRNRYELWTKIKKKELEAKKIVKRRDPRTRPLTLMDFDIEP